MDHHRTLAVPAQTVFTHLATPDRLGDWIPQIVHVDAAPTALIGLGTAFAITLHTNDHDLHLAADVTAYEPPWLITYRLQATNPVLISATCTTHPDGTQLHVHHTDSTAPLTIDLARLSRALNSDLAPRHREATQEPPTTS